MKPKIDIKPYDLTQLFCETLGLFNYCTIRGG